MNNKNMQEIVDIATDKEFLAIMKRNGEGVYLPITAKNGIDARQKCFEMTHDVHISDTAPVDVYSLVSIEEIK